MKAQNKGFTLIEVAIAIFILVVAIIGIYSSFSTLVTLTTGAFSRFTAFYLAQEGIEIVRNMRDNNWNQGNEWDYGLLDCEYGCEADYRTGTLMDPVSGLAAFSGNGNYLNINNDNGFYSYENIGNFSPTKFKRKITIVPQGENVLRVSVLAIWGVKDETFSVDVEEYLYNWYYFYITHNI